MWKLKYLSIALGIILFAGCNDDFLDLKPETSISPESFFQNTNDLELYTNTFYEYILPTNTDGFSDNSAVFADVNENLSLLNGSITASTVDGWDNWDELRRINYFLDYASSASGDPKIVNHHIGIARLMRAKWYYNMVMRYNDVPWYSHALNDGDEDMLYKARDSRELVVDSIMNDLEFAVMHIKEDIGNKTSISKWYACACMARIGLHEGTYRKYHDELNLENSSNVYLEKAINASLEIMNSGKFSIDNREGVDKAYQNLFSNLDLSKSPEIILFRDYSLEANLRYSFLKIFDWAYTFSRALMESYEVVNEQGETTPFTSIENYESKSFVEVFENRDPRFKQTFMNPGYKKPGYTQTYMQNLNLGGYPQIKYYPLSADQYSGTSSYTDLPVARLAEIYLIYAEAKAEMGNLTQDDYDKTVNLIRARVGLQPTILNNIQMNENLYAQYPNVTAGNQNEILEIRRERRIELACENLRWDDLMRWKAGHLLSEFQQGIYISGFGLHDLTGDGINDIGIFQNLSSNNVPANERNQYKFFYLDGSNVLLSEGDHGYIMSIGDNRNFIDPKYYYWPIPQTQMLLNPNFDQTIYWE